MRETVVPAKGGIGLKLQNTRQNRLLDSLRIVGGRLELVEPTADRVGDWLADQLDEQQLEELVQSGGHGKSS